MALSLAFGPILALVVIVSVALMLIGPQLVGSIAELVNLDELFVRLWGWLRFPIALLLLAVVLSVVYRFGPNAGQRFRSVVPGAALAVVLVGDLLGGFLFLPGQLRQLRRNLREPWCCRRFALLPLPLRFGGVVGCRTQRCDLPPAYGGHTDQEDENSMERIRGGHRREQ